MAGKKPIDARHQDDFIDESGWTSMEPEGSAKRSGSKDWKAAPPITPPAETDRNEGRLDPDPTLQRGPDPVEGDGQGGPV